MKSFRLMLLCLPLLAPHAFAQDATQLMHQLAGVYKNRFTSGVIVPGKADEPYPAEDVIEIVPYDASHVYIRAHLDFYNGHSCDIAGMGRFEHGAFVYHDPSEPMPGDPPCALKVGVQGNKLVLTDRATPDGLSSCSTYCGARGSLNHEIGMEKKRTIRYLDRFKASRQYAHAIEDLRKTEP